MKNVLNEKKLNNKGFSLVELIIVIAIMAVLIGILAPQYIKYVNRSKFGADQTLASELQGAVTTCLLDPVYTDAPSSYDAALAAPGTNKFWTAVYDIMGVSGTTAHTDLQNKLKLGKGETIKVTITTAGKVKVTVGNATGSKYTGDYALVVE